MPNKPSIHIIGTGAYIPTKVLTNHDLAKIVDTSDEWITSRTGIKERHVAAKDEAASGLAAMAASTRDRRRGSESRSRPVGSLVATATPDMFFPSTACFVQKALGIAEAVSFDVSAACSGFIYALETAKALMENGDYKVALVIGAEKLSSITNWKDRNTCVLFGDGAGAAVLQKKAAAGGVLSTYLRSAANHTEILKVPGGGSRTHGLTPAIYMEGKEVFKLAVHKMISAAEQALKRAGKKDSDLALLIPHQANLRIIEAIAERVAVPRERIFVNVDKYGNMSAATTIVALDEARRQGRVRKGDLVELIAFGAGPAWGRGGDSILILKCAGTLKS